MRGEILVVFSLCAGNIENYLFREDTRGAMSRERGYRRKILLHCICMRKKKPHYQFYGFECGYCLALLRLSKNAATFLFLFPAL